VKGEGDIDLFFILRMMANHKDLDAWKESMKLAKDVYRLSSGFPKQEIYGLTSQIRRGAVSIPSNIAEGAARSSDKEFIQFLYISLGSLAEIETQILLACDLSYTKDISILSKVESTRRLILGLIKYLKSK
jgi:four helix bundle protein